MERYEKGFRRKTEKPADTAGSRENSEQRGVNIRKEKNRESAFRSSAQSRSIPKRDGFAAERRFLRKKEAKKNTANIGNLVIGSGIPKICVPVVGETVDEMLRQADRIMKTPADLVEWRADYFRRIDDRSAVLSAARKLAARLEG